MKKRYVAGWIIFIILIITIFLIWGVNYFDIYQTQSEKLLNSAITFHNLHQDYEVETEYVYNFENNELYYESNNNIAFIINETNNNVIMKEELEQTLNENTDTYTIYSDTSLDENISFEYVDNDGEWQENKLMFNYFKSIQYIYFGDLEYIQSHLEKSEYIGEETVGDSVLEKAIYTYNVSDWASVYFGMYDFDEDQKEEIQSIFENYSGVTVTCWFDKDTGALVRYEGDYTDYFNKVYTPVNALILGSDSSLGTVNTTEAYSISYYTNYTDVEKITIPTEATTIK